jgi:hypothetical protein
MLFENEMNINGILIKSRANTNKNSKEIILNKYGLDTKKFQQWLSKVHNEIVNYTPEQLENELYRMARETRKNI